MRYLPDGRQMKAADGYTIREKKNAVSYPDGKGGKNFCRNGM